MDFPLKIYEEKQHKSPAVTKAGYFYIIIIEMIKYPNGLIYQTKNKKKQVKKTRKHILNAANRGMRFENEINKTNDFYLKKNIAIITKRPTPINVVRVKYSKNSAIITQAYFEKQSTTDYNGVYNGYYLDFEAKSTKNKNSFPLKNIAINQINHLEKVMQNKGIAFFLIEFYTINKVFFIDAKYVIKCYQNKKKRSISLNEIKKNGYQIERKLMPIYDYLNYKYFKNKISNHF